MGKKTKRERKFRASGGVKGRLQKGTIAKKGKIRKRKNRSMLDDDNNNHAAERRPQKRTETEEQLDARRDKADDFLGEDNLGDLDMESFFAKFSDKMEQDDGEPLKEAAGGDVDSDKSEESEEDVSGNEETEKRKGSDDEDNEADDDDDDDDDDDKAAEDSDDDSTSDDEDIEAAEARMKSEMTRMQSADPDFHKFLKENEESLLEFGDTDEADDEEEVAEEEEGKREEGDDLDRGDQQDATEQDAIHLTPKVLKSLEQGTFKRHGIKSLKKLLSAYRSACHLADASSEEDGRARPGESGKNYVIDSSKVFDQLMLMCLNQCHNEFQYHLLGESLKEEEEESDDENDVEQEADKDNTPLNPKTLERADRWSDMRPILISFFRSTLHLMSEAKEPELLTFILKALSKYMRYLTPFPRIAEAMLKSLTSLWSAPLDTSEDYQVVRLNAFLRIRQLALTQPFPFIEECLKKTYLAYAKRAKFGTASSVTSALPTLTFMGNCLVELYSLDYDSSYQHAFVYIRQLALLLRSVVQKKTAESFQQVYCWQYIHCLKLWVAVLSAQAPSEDGALMRSLIYPLAEIILGTVRLAPSPTRHLPLRFHCVRFLQQLSAAAEVFCPTASLLMDCLDFKEWYLKPKKSSSSLSASSSRSSSSSTRGVQIRLLLKLPKDDSCLRTHEQLEAAMGEFFCLMEREIELYRYSAGFPEYSIQIVQRLRRFCKETRNSRWRALGRGCIDKIERYAAFAMEERSKLNEAPKDVQRLECLRPVSEPSMRERHEAAIEREQRQYQQQHEVTTRRAQRHGAHDEPKGKEEVSSKKRKKNAKEESKTASKKKGVDVRAYSEDALKDDALEQDDEVQEGIDWSDEEEED